MSNNQNNKHISRARAIIIAAVSAVIAVALGLTCTLFFGTASPRTAVENVQAGEVETSANKNLTSSGTYNYTASGAIVNNDIIYMAYTGSGCYTITLPMGTYQFFCWGAEGGSRYSGGNTGGLGGYVYGTYTATSSFTVYVYIGGKGSDASGSIDGGHGYRYAGGYNGGGSGVGSAGAGGGGCTDMRIGGTSYSYQILVAGGGGGGANRNTGNTQQGTGPKRSSLVRYSGESGCTSRHSSSYPNDEGGGGGGYYGGAVTYHSDDGCQGYAGTNYTGGVTSPYSVAGNHSGNGTAQIKAISVNQAPVAKSPVKNINVGGRLEGKTTKITPDDIANDPDTNKTTLAFTNGNTSNLDTFSGDANKQLYIPNSSGGVDTSDTSVATVNKYIDWAWGDSTSSPALAANAVLQIKSVKMYPRNGRDGCTQNGRLTLYAKVRDTFGNSTARGWAYIMFYITINPDRAGSYAVSKNIGFTKTSNDPVYYLGNSDANAEKPVVSSNPSSIYNPNGGGRYTLIPQNSIRFGTKYKVEAKDLLKNVISKDKVVIVPNSTAAFTGNSTRKYKIEEYDAGASVTAKNASNNAISNAFESLTFVCERPEPEFQVLTCTLYVLEMNTAYGNNTYVVPDIPAVTIDIVFKMDNARPTLKDTSTDASAKAPWVEIDAMRSTPIELKDYYSDVDVAAGISSETHTIRAVTVPLTEYVQLDKYGNLVSSTFNKKSYFNVVPNGGDGPLPASALNIEDENGALQTGQLVGNEYSTGFALSYITDTVSDLAFVSYSYSGTTLTLTGLRATYNMYKPTRTTNGRVAKESNASGGLVLSTTSEATVDNAGDFYILINVQDKNDTADSGIWLPLGIRVKNAAPTDTGTERGASGKGTLPTASGKAGEKFYFTPMGITVEKTTTPLGKYYPDGESTLTSNNLIPLGSDSDNYFASTMLNGPAEPTPENPATGFLNEILSLTSTASEIATSVSGNASNEYFRVDLMPVYIPVSYFGGRITPTKADVETETVPDPENPGSTKEQPKVYSLDYFETGTPVDCYAINGFKITLNNWTHNRYLYATVNIKDSYPTPVRDGVKIAINVSNEKPVAYTNTEAGEGKVATFTYADMGDGITAGSTYNYELQENGSYIGTITYDIPMHSSVIITPYDIVKDNNFIKSGINMPSTGFTLNGLTGRFNAATGKFVQNSNDTNDGYLINGLAARQYGGGNYVDTLKSLIETLNGSRTINSDVSSSNAVNAAKETNKITYTDRLYFDRVEGSFDGYVFDPYTSGTVDSFADLNTNNTTAVDYKFGNSIKFQTGVPYDLDFLVINARSRTTLPVELTITLRDRTGEGASGEANGVVTIKVYINVVNSTPRVQYPGVTYTLSTNPTEHSQLPDYVNEPEYTVDDALDFSSKSGRIIPSTLVINASCKAENSNLRQNFLVDNEEDPVSFYTGEAQNVWVRDGTRIDSSTNDMSSYVSATITKSTLTIVARNSTQSIQDVYVLFYVTDERSKGGGRLDYQLCYIKVQVVNASMYINYGEDGFTKNEDNNDRAEWAVETVTEGDVTSARYFASGAAAARDLRETAGIRASDSQIKLLTTDTDILQKTVLSPVENVTNVSNPADHGYIKRGNGATNSHQYVPYAELSLADDPIVYSSVTDSTPVAAVISLANQTSTYYPKAYNTLTEADFANTNYINNYGINHYVKSGDFDILYFVDVTGSTLGDGKKVFHASKLRTPGDAECTFIDTGDNYLYFFDEYGRWKVTDWAVMVRPNTASEVNDFIHVSVMMRDDSYMGGDSAGVATSYDKRKSAESPVAVDGFAFYSYFMFINALSILPATYYNQFDKYYTVADGVTGKPYVITYDNDQDSLYKEHPLETLTLGGTDKTRAANNKDETVAGVHSGIEYAAGQNYVYDVYKSTTSDDPSVYGGEKAFRYSDTIKISSEEATLQEKPNNQRDDVNDKYVETYIPMSYFGMRSSVLSGFDDDLKPVYNKNALVAYNIPGDPYSLAGNSTDYKAAITISDGKDSWSGTRLSDNPYVYVKSFDYRKMTTLPEKLTQSDYLNNCLAYSLSAHPFEGPNAKNIFDSTINTTQAQENRKNTVSYNANKKNADSSTWLDDRGTVDLEGKFLYLKDQTKNVMENLFGLRLCKKSTRSSSAALTITVDIAYCSAADDTGILGAGAITTNYTQDNADEFTARITYKLEIGNSPITLTESGPTDGSDGVQIDARNGYFTKVDLVAGSDPYSISLGREGSKNYDRTLLFADGDEVRDGNNRVIADKSDQAYFYYESTFGSNRWSDVYNKAKSVHNERYEFTNTSTTTAAQNSMKNFFGKWDGGTFEPADEVGKLPRPTDEFIPNDSSMYLTAGNKEGYSSYFSITMADGNKTLKITPLRKTTLNQPATGTANYSNADYALRGLVRYNDNGVVRGYYPLKILVYDSHGEGPEAGSYVALEIRISITSSSPTFSANLKRDDSPNAGVNDRKLELTLAVGEFFELNVAEMVNSNDLLKKRVGNNYNVYWQTDFAELENMQDKEFNDKLNYDTGTYLMSPLSRYVKNPTDNDLTTGLGDNAFTDKSKTQAAVVMSMGYDQALYPLMNQAIPNTCKIRFEVNRRLATTSNNPIKFSLVFTDSDGNSSPSLNVYITIGNSVPVVRQSAANLTRDLKMRVNDSFTIVTTPYDRFTGTAAGEGKFTECSDTAKESLSNNYFKVNKTSTSSVESATNLVIRNRNLCPNATETKAVTYDLLTKSVVDASGSLNLALHSYNPNNANVQDLGYVALFDDDAPWDLRFKSNKKERGASPVQFYNDSDGCFAVEGLFDRMPIRSGEEALPISIKIVASSCCKDYPITVTAVDGDGAYVSFTMYVTVESTKPEAIREADTNRYPRHVALNTVKDNTNEEIPGYFDVYMYTATEGNNGEKSASIITDIKAKPTPAPKTVRSYGSLTLPVNRIAYDPDGNDNKYIALYTDENDTNYNVFMFNGLPMQRTGSRTYYNDLFRISISDDYTSFEITCLTFNPYSDGDELSFYVRDVGNNVFANAIPITIRLITLYANIANTKQAVSSAISGSSVQQDAVYTVNVKSIDDYNGTSADYEALSPAEKEDVLEKNSIYTVLNYSRDEDYTDRDNAGNSIFRLRDPDVENNTYNLNYGIKVYALMDQDEQNQRVYASKQLKDVGSMFEYNYGKNHWALKTDNIREIDNKYLVAGVNTGGARISKVNNALNVYLSQFFVFDIGSDGVSLSFRPISSNISTKILFYVQVEKMTYRRLVPSDSYTTCGTMFYVDVNDSAPVANADTSIARFAGSKGMSKVFKIYDENDPDYSLFHDSDAGDMIEVPGFTSQTNLAYENAFPNPEEIDWQRRPGVEMAIFVDVNNTDDVVKGIPARSLKVTVNRRIDKLDENGNYLPSVTVPIIITGEDKAHRIVQSMLYIDVCNSDFDLNEAVAGGNKNVVDIYGVGYSVTPDGGMEKTYDIDVSVAPGVDTPAMAIHFVTENWFSDPDYTYMALDTESFKLIVPDTVDRNKYVSARNTAANPFKVTADDGDTEDIAEITPLFGNRGALEDANHFEGVSIVAKSYKRGITGSAYLRIVDRSCGDTEHGGVTLRINITVLNAAPEVKPGKKTSSIIITGSDTIAPEEFLIDVNEYVRDLNGDELSIYSCYPVPSDDIHCTNTRVNEGDIFELETGGSKITVKPRVGFYGKQTLQVYVADGDAYSDPSVRTVDFSIDLTVLYDHRVITELNVINAIRSLPTKITPEILFKPIADTYFIEEGKGPSLTSRVLNSAEEGEKLFNPGKDFIIVDLKTSSNNTTISKDLDGDFQFVCSKEADEVNFVAYFIRKIDENVPDVVPFNKSFKAVVGKNSAPKLLQNFSRDGGFTFHSGSGDYDLDSKGSVTLTADRLFSDVDIAYGDKLTFDAKVIEVTSPTLCSVKVSEDGAYLTITFNYRGETDIVIGVKDRTGDTTKVKLHVNNIDRPEPSFINKIKISYESSPFIWLGVAIGFVVLIVLLIIIILLMKRRKRKREELEAILVSEMELEEQMMMLSGGMGANPYASFGYLPPTVSIQNNPGLMLDSGANVPNTNVIGLNPGQEPGAPGMTQAPPPPTNGSNGFDEF